MFNGKSTWVAQLTHRLVAYRHLSKEKKLEKKNPNLSHAQKPQSTLKPFESIQLQ